MKTATFKKSSERLHDGTPMPFAIVIAGSGTELYGSRAEAMERIEDLEKRGVVIHYFT